LPFGECNPHGEPSAISRGYSSAPNPLAISIKPETHKAIKQAKVLTDELDASIAHTILGLPKEVDTLGLTANQLKLYELAALAADQAPVCASKAKW